MDSPVLSTEQVSRFVFDRGKLKTDRVVWRAFWDPGQNISVFRIDGLLPAQIWALSSDDPRAPAAGRGDLAVEYIRQIELDVVAVEPPERHAEIVGWPEYLETTEERIKTIAKQLAAEAVPHFPM